MPKGHVDGLAIALANEPACRARLLDSGTLLQWKSPQTTGVVGNKNLRLNVDLMLVVGQILCPQSSASLGLNVGPIKAQAGLLQLLQPALVVVE